MIIAIYGLEGSGKSTTARFLASALDRKGYSTKICSFAEPLKTIASQYLKIDKTNRNLLEEFAMDLRRLLGNDIFSNALNIMIKNTLYDVYIIDDIRYPHELNMLNSFGKIFLLHTTSKNIETARDMDALRYLEFDDYIHKSEQMYINLPSNYDDLYSAVQNIAELI